MRLFPPRIESHIGPRPTPHQPAHARMRPLDSRRRIKQAFLRITGDDAALQTGPLHHVTRENDPSGWHKTGAFAASSAAAGPGRLLSAAEGAEIDAMLDYSESISKHLDVLRAFPEHKVGGPAPTFQCRPSLLHSQEQTMQTRAERVRAGVCVRRDRARPSVCVPMEKSQGWTFSSKGEECAPSCVLAIRPAFPPGHPMAAKRACVCDAHRRVHECAPEVCCDENRACVVRFCELPTPYAPVPIPSPLAQASVVLRFGCLAS